MGLPVSMVSGGRGDIHDEDLALMMHTSVAQSRDTNTTSAKQFCCSGTSMIGTRSKTRKMAMMATRR